MKDSSLNHYFLETGLGRWIKLRLRPRSSLPLFDVAVSLLLRSETRDVIARRSA